MDWFGMNWDTISGGPTDRGGCAWATPQLGRRRVALQVEPRHVVALHGSLDGRPLGGLRIGDLDRRSIGQSGAVLWVLKAMADGPEHQRAIGGIVENQRADGQHIGWEQAHDAPLLLGTTLGVPPFQSPPKPPHLDRRRGGDLTRAPRPIDG